EVLRLHAIARDVRGDIPWIIFRRICGLKRASKESGTFVESEHERIVVLESSLARKFVVRKTIEREDGGARGAIHSVIVILFAVGAAGQSRICKGSCVEC